MNPSGTYDGIHKQNTNTSTYSAHNFSSCTSITPP
ncbi:hypothetical protein PF003_g10844 [Phytophthora fragariae]|nr:hypothetical protein PF003_g10844 [Phytophthora fragariae]